MAFISRHYLEKQWTNHERRSAQARSLSEDRPYLLPVRLDDTEIPGLRPTVVYLDARKLAAMDIVQAIRSKLGGVVAGNASQDTITLWKVPETESSLRLLLASRPPAWEYLLFAAILRSQLMAREEEYRDFEIGFSRLSGQQIDWTTASDFMKSKCDEMVILARTLDRLFVPSVQEQAFGAGGEPGDPDRIMHLAKRIGSVYESSLSWIAEVRGVTHPGEFEDALRYLALMGSGIVKEFRNFVAAYVSECNTISERLQRHEQVVLELELTVRIPDDAKKGYEKALKRLAMSPTGR